MSRALIDLTFDASEEAKICLNCDKQTCKSPDNCTRFKDEMRKLKEKERLKGGD